MLKSCLSQCESELQIRGDAIITGGELKQFSLQQDIDILHLNIPKLFQWLLGGGAFIAVWAAVILEYIVLDLNDSTKDVVLFFPVFIAVAFAFYSIAVIGYRVATFNDCLAAAEELQLEIEDARKDLKSKGFKFD